MIGIYDSGVGGLYFLNILKKSFPMMNLAYFADVKSMPLGEKSAEEIRLGVLAGVEFLQNQGCELVILACNTAVSHSLRYLQQEWLPMKNLNLSALGVTRVLAEAFHNQITPSKKTLMLATSASVNSKYFQLEFLQAKNSAKTFPVDFLACPGLADLVEQNEPVLQYLSNLFGSLKVKDYDTILLGCTHYWWVKDEILQVARKQFNPEIRILEIEEVYRKSFSDWLQRKNLTGLLNGKGKLEFYPQVIHNYYLKLSGSSIEI